MLDAADSSWRAGRCLAGRAWGRCPTLRRRRPSRARAARAARRRCRAAATAWSRARRHRRARRPARCLVRSPPASWAALCCTPDITWGVDVSKLDAPRALRDGQRSCCGTAFWHAVLLHSLALVCPFFGSPSNHCHVEAAKHAGTCHVTPRHDRSSIMASAGAPPASWSAHSVQHPGSTPEAPGARRHPGGPRDAQRRVLGRRCERGQRGRARLGAAVARGQQRRGQRRRRRRERRRAPRSRGVGRRRRGWQPAGRARARRRACRAQPMAGGCRWGVAARADARAVCSGGRRRSGRRAAAAAGAAAAVRAGAAAAAVRAATAAAHAAGDAGAPQPSRPSRIAEAAATAPTDVLLHFVS